MPSASSKSDKVVSTEATDPLKQAIVIMGHKIRNLEKRKNRLDSYKKGIKSLTKEQVEAVSKYDEVVQQLEITKEYIKQFTVISVDNDKLKKKQAKKDAQEKYVAEINKVKQILQIQDVLQNLGASRVREDFLTGRNGAVQLTEADLKALDDLCVEVSPKRISEDGTPFPNDQFQKAAEFFLAIVDGKNKKIVGSTGAKLRELVNSIHICGYFDKQSAETNGTSAPTKLENEKPEEEKKFLGNREILSNMIVSSQSPPQGNKLPVPNTGPIQPVMSGAPILPQPPMMQPGQPQIMPPSVPNIIPTPVSQVESSFFNAQGFKPPAPPSSLPPPIQNPRQINDVIQSVTGKFSFLQESELEIPEMNSFVVPGNSPATAPQIPGVVPSSIPTQTFTNQNFNGQPGGAPPYPPNYPPQPAAFQAFVPAFPAFVAPNASSIQNSNPSTNPVNTAPILPVNNGTNPNISTNNNISATHNKCNNNILNPIPSTSNRNHNINFNQSQQQLPPGFPNQPSPQNIPQPPGQLAFQHGNVNMGSLEKPKIENTVRRESEVKEKQEEEKPNWSQPESKNWADDWTEPLEWNSTNQNQSDETSNKFPLGRPSRNGGGVPRNTNGYQGSRTRTSRPGGYREPLNHQGGGGIGGGTNNYYQNQNGYQSRSDRHNEYLGGGKGNSDFRDNNFKERGDFSNRDRENRDNYGGGFKRGANNRGHNMKGPMDRGDRPVQIPRNNSGGPKGSRNLNNRPPSNRTGSSFQRQPSNPVGQPK